MSRRLRERRVWWIWASRGAWDGSSTWRRGLARSVHRSLCKKMQAATILRLGRLWSNAVGSIKWRADRCVWSSRRKWQSAAPIKTSGQYSITGHSNPQKTVWRPRWSRRGEAFLKGPRRWLALTATAQRWRRYENWQSKVTPSSFRWLSLVMGTPANSRGGKCHYWRWRSMVMACDLLGSSTPL